MGGPFRGPESRCNASAHFGICQRQSEFRLTLELLGTGCAIGERDAGAEGEPFTDECATRRRDRQVGEGLADAPGDRLRLAGVDVAADEGEVLRAALEMSRAYGCRKMTPL